MIRKRTTLTATQKKQRLFVMLFGCILLGAAVGMLLLYSRKLGFSEKEDFFLGMFFRKNAALSALWTEAVGKSVLFLWALFLLGFSAVGQPFVWALLLLFGVCMGGALQVQCGSGDALLRCMALLLYDVPISVLLVMAGREALRFSGYFTTYGFRDDPAEQMVHQTRMYFARFLVLLILLLFYASMYAAVFYAGILEIDKAGGIR